MCMAQVVEFQNDALVGWVWYAGAENPGVTLQRVSAGQSHKISSRVLLN